ncbi:atp-dependent RNA helicase ddx51 [Anaeramoeba flamelloides]|uniref:ATP-dependent RNA helicase n=1 Tax=Anaeramoeba flamelloides TaxID=1746091 RepID=A0AAV7YYZ6_9EUKA|nr:atp-dependent RNA helicase ddx51 [Anaeramoeba flamelloides]
MNLSDKNKEPKNNGKESNPLNITKFDSQTKLEGTLNFFYSDSAIEIETQEDEEKQKEKEKQIKKWKKSVPLWMKKGQLINSSIETYDPKKSEHIINLLPKNIQLSLKKLKIKHLFPVQIESIPLLLQTNSRLTGVKNDICIQAPTGSGKTLAYSLMNRVIVRLRALIILPTRNLASQTKEVLDCFCQNCDLRVGTLFGSSSIEEEFSQIMNTKIIKNSKSIFKNLDLDINNNNNNKIINEITDKESELIKKFVPSNCKVDIIVCTPGRLVELILRSSLFQDLRFLVVDEADRLISQSYHDWLNRINQIIRKNETNRFKRTIQKILLTATFTKNPSKLSSLELKNPLYIYSSTSLKFRVPDNLTEYLVVAKSSSDKLPLMALLLREIVERKERCLCFTNSIEESHRLKIFLKHFNHQEFKVTEYSKKLIHSKREKVLEKFLKGEKSILICSDVMTRGMDFDVKNIINYNNPQRKKTYIHRVGRTSRAGKSGRAYTFVEKEYEEKFMKLLRKIEDSQREIKIWGENSDLKLEEIKKECVAALKILKTQLVKKRQNYKGNQNVKRRRRINKKK